MTRVGVFSDTHGDLSRLPAALEKAGPLDSFVHLGDYGGDAKQIAALLPVPYRAVRGNCDVSGRLPRQAVVEIETASLLLLHGDGYAGTYQLALLAEEQRCAAVLFGHTHTPLLSAQGAVLILNPGSLSRPRYGSAPSFAVLTVEARDVNAKIITL